MLIMNCLGKIIRNQLFNVQITISKKGKKKHTLKIRKFWKEQDNQFIILHWNKKKTKNYGAFTYHFLKNKESNMEILL